PSPSSTRGLKGGLTNHILVLELAHSHPMAGHLGQENTIQRIRDCFHWPGLDAECQRTSPRKPPPSPLIPLPIIDVPFERIGMDVVGPLPKSARGHEHILVVVDYATRKATAKTIAQELFQLFSRVGIPKEILTDQGTPFMSRLMVDLCRLLRVKQLRTTVYHPQTDGLDRQDWDLMLPYVLPQLGSPHLSSCSAGNPVASSISRLPITALLSSRSGPSPTDYGNQAVNLLKNAFEPVVVDVNPHLLAAQKGELQHLIGQFSDVFSPLPGRTKELLSDSGLIGLLSPIVMVPKPDGTLRFCNDFRRLNEISEFDSYPMPRVDELLDRLGRARYISTMDLTKGTAFSTPSGHWQYRTLPFGLHGAPASFQRLMDIILRPHQAYAAAYLDNVVIHSEALRRVLTELRRAGLTANPRKCHLALHEAKYLGYQVGRGLIRPQEKKVEAVRTTPKPESKTQVRAFLGLAGYYRCFIPNFSSLASPLTDLTRKGQPEKIQWTRRSPRNLCPFLLQTDASDAGLGAVLSQVQEGEEHPLLYISRKLTPAKRHYATVEKEALAIKWAVLELRYYLLGRRFTLVTDHAPLQWMVRAKNTNARVTRWFLALQDFHFDIQHRAGAANANADGLSRIWAAFAGLSGVTPHPPPISPLLTHIIHWTRTTLGGEGGRGGGGGGGEGRRASQEAISVALETNEHSPLTLMMAGLVSAAPHQPA
ncbi:hypothetical protein M9458_044566, partial [Cirrhinus mrigala]